MRAFAIALSLLVLTSVGAVAQPSTTPPAQPQPMPMDGMRTGKVVAVGIGALLGIVAAEAIAVGDAAAIVGGVAGGAIGAWWYTSSGDSASPRGNVKPASMHEAAYHGQTLVTIR